MKILNDDPIIESFSNLAINEGSQGMSHLPPWWTPEKAIINKFIEEQKESLKAEKLEQLEKLRDDLEEAFTYYGMFDNLDEFSEIVVKDPMFLNDISDDECFKKTTNAMARRHLFNRKYYTGLSFDFEHKWEINEHYESVLLLLNFRFQHTNGIPYYQQYELPFQPFMFTWL